MVQRVVVIGAGAAGLAVLRRFTARKESFEVVCFEQLPFVGGLWNYCDNITDPNHPTGSEYTAIYKNLRTTVPKQALMFTDIPFPDELPSYISHTDVKEYLNKYADKFQLKKYIKFNKQVVKVHPKMNIGKEDVWTVNIKDICTKLEEQYEFDIVIVCKGKYSLARYPKIEGMDVFKGQMIHSKKYRDPEEFKGKRVLVVGAGFSGIDISDEIAECAEKTWLSHRFEKKLNISKAICQVGEIMRLTFDSAIVCKQFNDDDNEDDKVDAIEIFSSFKDHSINYEELFKSSSKNESNTSVDTSSSQKHCYPCIGPIDVILFATGFLTSYPFLSGDCGMAVSSPFHMGPLYKDLVCINKPTLSFVGILNGVLPFLEFDCQAQFLVALYEGRISMPCNENKMEEELKYYNDLKREHGVDVEKKPLVMPHFQWNYYKQLASIAGFEPPPYYFEHLFNKVWKLVSVGLSSYKNCEYKMGDEGLYVDA